MSTTRFLTIAGCALGALALVACQPKPTAKGPTAFDKTVVADCYTVDLFTIAEVQEPEGDVPGDWRGYSGKWGGAAWEGKWCHDLHVLSIGADGEVEVMELHAPYEQWGKQATAFRRKGFINDEGRLRLRYSGVDIEYWLVNGRLHGVRTEGGGEMRIALTPKV
ncbi:MAG: hypothetical protein AAF360_15445 [Pseudomonadota bacterium]